MCALSMADSGGVLTLHQGGTLGELRKKVQDAGRCHFEGKDTSLSGCTGLRTMSFQGAGSKAKRPDAEIIRPLDLHSRDKLTYDADGLILSVFPATTFMCSV